MDRSILLAALMLAALLGACAGRDVVLVSAASSLTDAFGAMEAAFEAEHGDVDVVLNLAGSSRLADQIAAGAPADVFAPADPAHLAPFADGVAFATTPMVIAATAGNPAGILELEDFARAEPFLGLCAVGVPCGDLAREALDSAGVTPSLDTEEPNVRALLSKVADGELDAGIVYASDVVSSEVDAVALDPDHAVSATYQIGVLPEAPNPDGADAFVAFVLSDTGRSILLEHGFELP